MMTRCFKSLVLFQILLTPFSSVALAWGFNNDLKESWAKAQLVFTAIEKHRINYCIKVEDPGFQESNVQLQIEAALELWLNSALEVGATSVVISKVACSDRELNLMVHLGKETKYVDLNAYQIPVIEVDRYYSLVKINLDYVHNKESTPIRYVDFSAFLRPGQEDLQELLREVSIIHPTTIYSFADQLGVSYLTVYFSVYPTLIHEFGHSFGLCDTYPEQFEKQCDSAHRSTEQPPSVMQDSTYFYLTQDDIEGIQKLFRWAAGS